MPCTSPEKGADIVALEVTEMSHGLDEEHPPLGVDDDHAGR